MQICGATNRRGGPCGKPAGWGTDHLGQGRCRLHGGASKGAPKGNRNSVKTGEFSRAEEFAKDCAEAPVDPTSILQQQARDTYGRLRFMYRLLMQTEQQLMDLAAQGDGSALSALAVVEISRKQEPRTVGEGDQATTQLVDVELSTKSRSLLDTWLAQHEAITRVELLYGRTAERLKPKDALVPGTGGIGTLIVNAGIPGVDYDLPDDRGEA